MTAANVLLAVFLCCAGGAIAVLPVCRNRDLAGRVAFGFTALASTLAASAAVSVLATGPGQATTLWLYGSAFRIQVDGLSALFILLIALVSAAAALYSIEYMAHYPVYGLHRYYPYFLLFVGGMYGIVCITDLMAGFFVCWQVMTLASFFLVRFEYRRPENVRAATRYLIWMQVACGLILLGAGLLAHGPAARGGEALLPYDFDAISHGLPELLRTRPTLVTLGLLCFLLGFGIKAGVWPFGQWWLPAAHPAAPSPVSALLSGVMIKTGIYGLMRSFLWLVPAAAAGDYPSDIWGAVLAALGTVTLFIGTTQALGQDQSKRLLAYSSIGQVGYILLGLGAALALIGPGRQDSEILALAALAVTACLLHTLNHGLYKSLLFLNAGSLLAATGTQDLNQMGGLIRYLPLTGITALVAAFSISGVPLFNGFISKWGLFASTILGRTAAPYLAVCAVLAMLTSVITLALFLKFFGVTFLSRVSRHVAARAAGPGLREVGWSMQGAQVALAAACVLLGLAPQAGYRLVYLVLQASPDGLGQLLAKPVPLATSGLTGVLAPGGQAVLIPLVVALVVAALFGLAAALWRMGGATQRQAEPWLCGYAVETDHMRYGARNLYREVVRYLPWVATPPSRLSAHGAGRPADSLIQGPGRRPAGPGN